MEKYNTNDVEAVEIRRKIEYLNLFDYDLKIYDVISMEEVRKFESENNVRLPDDYVWFITNVGNGGTWRDCSYSFYPLESTYFSDERLSDLETGQKDFSLNVLSLGCSYSFGIILKGEHFGEISYNGDGVAVYMDKIKVHRFKELYIKWLNETYMGYDEYGFERRLSGTIEDNLRQYKHLNDIELLWSIFSKINSKVVYDEFISEVYEMFVAENENKNKVLFAKILIKSGYKDVLDVLEKIFIPKNYSTIILELYLFVRFENAEIYPMLVEILKHYETLDKAEFGYCLEMIVTNPEYNEKDIIDILTSDDKKIICYMASVSTYNKDIKKRIGKYVDKAEIRYTNE